jgi:hypothetical protein
MTRCFRLCRLMAMLLLASVATAETSRTEPSLIPWPAKVVMGRGVFVVNGQTPICARGTANSVAQQLQTTVRAMQGLDLETRRCGRGPAIELVLSPSASVTDAEGYTLDVRASGIRIEARAGAGLFYGAMTAAQLLSTDDRARPSGQRGNPRRGRGNPRRGRGNPQRGRQPRERGIPTPVHSARPRDKSPVSTFPEWARSGWQVSGCNGPPRRSAGRDTGRRLPLRHDGRS